MHSFASFCNSANRSWSAASFDSANRLVSLPNQCRRFSRHGFFSQRLIAGDAGHVGQFTDYVKDFKVFAMKAVEAKMPKPFFFIGSSMGAAIGTHFAIVNPNFFKALVVVAPMYEISSNSVYGMAIYAAAKGLFDIGWGDRFAPSRKPFDPNFPFTANITTHSQERFSLDMWLIKKNPQIAVGGPTTNWVLEASRETKFLRQNSSKILTPLLIVQAGADSVVNNVAQARVCSAAKTCTLFILDGAYHSVLIEVDRYRTAAIDRALEMYQTVR
ncbi:MAG: alpha/beta fold hydrolase [Proteobacteria bacterium]|nr:MAG: alpha/beta fold hydrolase [Pseudomonadota bacterium]